MSEYIISIGETSTGIILKNDSMTVSSGGIASNTTVSSSGRFYVSSGGTANNTTVNSIGGMYLYGGMANDTTVNSFASIVISSGGVANNTTVNYEGKVWISSGGTANGVSVSPEGYLYAFAGGYVSGIVAGEDACIRITVAPDTYAAGSLNGIPFEMKDSYISGYSADYGYLVIESGGSADDITVMNWGGVTVSGGGKLSGATVNAWSEISVESGGSANSIQVTPYGRFYVSSGGTATGISANRNSYLCLDVAPGTYAQGLIGASAFEMKNGVISDFELNNTILTICSGGTATGLVAAFRDRLNLVVAPNTWIEGTSNGSAFEIKDGIASACTVDAYCTLSVLSGGIAKDVLVQYEMYVESGGVASGIVVNKGTVCVSSGGEANGATIDNGNFNVASGGAASGIVVNNGYLEVYGGTAMGIVENGGYVDIMNGAVVSFASNSFSGLVLKEYSNNESATVHSGTTANQTRIDSYGNLYICDGGLANDTTVNSYGYFYVASGGVAHNVNVGSNGTLYLLIGGKLTGEITIERAANVSLSSGAIIDFDLRGATPDDFPAAKGLSYISGTPDYTLTVEAGQAEGIYLLAEGTDSFDQAITVNNGEGTELGALTMDTPVDIAGVSCTLFLSAGDLSLAVGCEPPESSVVSGLMIADGTVNVNSGEIYYQASVNSGGVLNINGGGLTKAANVNNEGILNVLSDGSAKRTGVNNGGVLNVLNGGRADFSVLESGGSISVAEGGAAFSTEVKSGGGFLVSGSGTANDTTVDRNGIFQVSGGGTANGTDVNGGTFHVLEGGTAADTMNNGDMQVIGGVANNTINDGTLRVFDGGKVNNTSVGRILYVSSGGTATDTTISTEADLVVCEGGIAINTTLTGAEGWLTISSGGTADNITILYGDLIVSSGGTATNVNWSPCSGFLWYEDGAVVTLSSQYSGVYFGGYHEVISHSDVMDSMAVDYVRYMYIMSGGTANDTIVTGTDECGLYIHDGGVANNTTLEEYTWFTVYSGGTANGVTATSSGTVYVRGGGKVTGRMTLENGSVISASAGSVVEFDLTGGTQSDAPLLNNYALVKGDPTFTVTVSGSMENGQYSLAGGAAGFDRTITVQNASGESLGELAAGSIVSADGKLFSLLLDDSLLSLVVNDVDLTPPVLSVLSANYTEPTPDDVTVSAVFTDNNEVAETLYRIGADGEWTSYDTSVSLTENATVFFKAVDTAGNESEVASYTVSIIDRSLPFSGFVVSTSREVESGQVFIDTIVSSGTLAIKDGGYATGTTVADSGKVHVSSGGAADGVTVNPGGRLIVSSGGTADEIVENGGYVSVADGAGAVFKPNVISRLSVNDLATIHSGTTAFSATVGPGALLEVFSGGAVSSATVNPGGRLLVSSGGTAGGVTISSGGSLYVSSGGTALNVVWAPWLGQLDYDPGAIVTLDGPSYSGVYWSSIYDASPVRSSATVSGMRFNAQRVYVMSGGLVTSARGVYGGGFTVCDGGMVESVYLETFCSMVISSGGVAKKVGLLGENAASTYIRVLAGGLLVDGEIGYPERGGQIHVSSGGTAINTNICSCYGFGNRPGLILSSGGTAIGTVIEGDRAGLDVNSGCVVVSTLLKKDTILMVYSGGIADDTIVGFSEVPDGRKPSSSRTSLTLSGGVANRTTVSSGGTVFVSSGALANSVTVQSGGRLSVIRGKLTGRVVCHSGGTISVQAGTVDFNLTDVLPGAVARYNDLSFFTMGENVVFTVTVNADQMEGTYLLAEGASSFSQTITVVNAAGEELGSISAGETVTILNNSYTLSLKNSVLTLQVGANPVPPLYTSNGIVVDGGVVIVQSGEVYYDTPVNPGGTLLISSGGTALKTTENGGYVDVRDGAGVEFASNTIYGLVLGQTASATVHSGTTAVGASVLSGGSLHVFSGGVATDIVWTPCEGHITIDADASATFASQYSGVYYGSDGQLISKKTSMSGVSMDPLCELYVMSGGTADIRLSSGGRVSVASGGTATISSWSPFTGQVEIEGGADVTFVTRKLPGVYYGSDGELLSSADVMSTVTLGSSCEMHVLSSGIASRTTVGSGGSLFVHLSGLVNSVTVESGGRMTVLSGAYAISPIVSSGGRMAVLSGGTAVGVVLHDTLLASSAGLLAAVAVSSHGKLIVEAGTADYVAVSSGGSMNVINGTANSVTLFGGAAMTVCEGASVDNVAVDSEARITISSGATATNIALTSGAYLGLSLGTDTYVAGTQIIEQNGEERRFEIRDGIVSGFYVSSAYLEIGPGVSAEDMIISPSGVLVLSSGGKLSGKITCREGGIISACDGAVINFVPLPWATASINDLSAVQGAPVYTVTVDPEQQAAVYTLADGAAGFSGTITVVNKSGAELGTISVGETVTLLDTLYTLDLSDGALTLRVGDNPVPPTGDRYNGQSMSPNELFCVSSGEVANDTIVNSCVANGSTGLQVLSGGLANNTTISDHGCMYVSSGGSANGISLKEGGFLSVESGGVVNYTVIQSNGGMVYVSEGAVLNDTTVNSNAYLRVIYGGEANGVTVKSGGNLYVSAGGSASGIEVMSGASLFLLTDCETYAAGVVEGVPFEIIDGVCTDFAIASCYYYIGSGATVRNAVVDSGSVIYVKYGGKLTGRVTIESDGIVSATTSNAIIDFDVSLIEPGTAALYNDLTLIQCRSGVRTFKPVYTLTVDAQQQSGTYVLADVTSGFKYTDISDVRTTEGESFGKYTDDMLVNNSFRLKLNTRKQKLILTVSAIDTIAPTVSNIQVSTTAPTDQPVVVTAEFADNRGELSSRLYKVGQGDWTKYSGDVTVYNNTTVYFKAIDRDGNESEVVSYTVSNIDSLAGVVIADGQSVSVPDGETFLNASISVGGKLIVESGGTADGVAVSGGELIVESGGTATGIQWTPCEGFVHVSDGGYATFASQYSGVYFGSGGQLISSAATMDSTSIYLDSMYVFSGGVANNARVSGGGRLFVEADGIATDAVLSGGAMHVSSGGAANGAVVWDGLLHVSSGGVANNANVSGGTLFITSGGVANSARVSGGAMHVSSGGAANGVTVNGGELNVESGGTANGISVRGRGQLTILSGGTATDIEWTPCDGRIEIEPGGVATFVSQYSGVYYGSGYQLLSCAATVTSMTLAGGYEINVMADGSVNDITVNEGGCLYVSSGGSACDITVNGGELHVFSGGVLDSAATVIDDGEIYVEAGGTANGVSVSPDGYLYVSSGGTATDIVWTPCEGNVAVEDGGHATFASQYSGAYFGTGYRLDSHAATLNSKSLYGGCMYLFADGVANNINVENGRIFVCSGGTANRTSFSRGGRMYVSFGGMAKNTVLVYNTEMYVSAGGTADGTTLNSRCSLMVSSGGEADHTTVGFSGRIDVSSGGTANGLTVSSGGALFVEAGGRMTGRMIFESGAVVSVFDETILDFDISELAPGGVARVNDLSRIKGTPVYTLTISGAQDTGTYSLAKKATYFDSVITVRSTAGESLGTISVGNPFVLDNTIFTLAFGVDATSDVLTLTVSRNEPPTVSDIQASTSAPTNQDVTVTAVFADDIELASSLYRLGEDGEWTDYVDGVVVSENTTVYFKAVDAAGNESEVVSYMVANIDKLAPVAPVASADVTTATSGDVLVSAVFSDDSVVKEYSLDGETWLAYAEAVKFTENGTVQFRGIDEAGNVSEVASFEVANIDKVAPEVPVATADITKNTNGNVLVSAAFSDDSVVREYSLDGETWLAYTAAIVFSENGSVFFRGTDAAGNVSEVASYEVANIVAPDNKPDTDNDDFLYDKKTGWNDANISVSNTITGNGELDLDAPGSINRDDYHNMFGNDGSSQDAGDVAKIDVETAAKLTFTIDSTAAGTFYVYQDGVDKKGKRTQITVGKVAVKAGKTATLKDVCLTGDGAYYVAMVAKNVKKAGTEGLYNVTVSSSTFFVDADDGGNNTAAKATVVEVGRGTTAVVLDSNEMTGSTEFANFVGFSDSVDYAKLDLASGAYLSFDLKADGAAKFTIWKQDAKGKLSKAGGVTSLTAKNKFTATTKAQFLDTSKFTYYVSMESSDAGKGGSAYYNVSLSGRTIFFDSADNGANNVLYDKKAKAFKDDANFVATELVAGSQDILLDSNAIGNEAFGNFVGYGDAADYAKIVLTQKGSLSFKISALADVTFEIWQKGTDKKGKAVLTSLQKKTSVTVKDYIAGASATTAALTLDAGEYYISVTAKSTKPVEKGGAFYNVTATFNASGSASDALAMPETSDSLAGADRLAMTDALSFGQLDTAALANVSASSLAGLDDKSVWRNLTLA